MADQNEETYGYSDLPEEIPDSQPEYISWRTQSRVFPDEIPDSQESLSDLESEDPLSSNPQDVPSSTSRLFPEEIPDSQDSLSAADLGEELNTNTHQPLDLLDEHRYSNDNPDLYLTEDTTHRKEILVGQRLESSTDSLHTTDVHEETEADESASFHTQPTVIVPTELNKRIPLHKTGLFCNGRLPREAPQYLLAEGEEVMEEPDTQPVFDERREGNKAEDRDKDEANVIAILHPSSPATHKAVELTAAAAPQHIYQNWNQSHVAESCELGLKNSKTSGTLDIALRFNSRVIDPRMGFIFGRNSHLSDILLGENQGESKKTSLGISNKHFRIFLNQYNSLMIEDTSTNGTSVGEQVLHGEKKRADIKGELTPRWNLQHGDIIRIPHHDKDREIVFAVEIFNYNTIQMESYRQNLMNYQAYIAQCEATYQAEQQAGIQRANAPNKLPMPTNDPFSDFQSAQILKTPAIIPNAGRNSYGMEWDGGNKYNVVGVIGSGAFSTVYRLSSKRYGELFAVKQLDKHKFVKDGVLGSKFTNELDVMISLSHPNIIQYRDHHETERYLYIVMEYMPFGDLREWIKKKPMPEYMALKLAHQMLEAIDYLHKKGIAHRDIKPDNILLAGHEPSDGIFKLADFGLSKIIGVNDKTHLKTFCGTMLYLAPEVYPGYENYSAGLNPRTKHRRGRPPPRTYKYSVDIWSLGVVLYQSLAAVPPFDTERGREETSDGFLSKIMTEPVDYRLLVGGGVGEEAIAFLRLMLVKDPAFRAHETDLLRHPWLNPIEADELDASQLSLTENDAGDIDYDDDEMENPRDPKRHRGHRWPEDEDEDDEMLPGGLPKSYPLPKSSPPIDRGDPPPIRPREENPATWSQVLREFRGSQPETDAGPVDIGDEMGSEDLAKMYRQYGEAPPDADVGSIRVSQDEGIQQPRQAARLFGEIGSSALGSSGVLGENANMALEVSSQGSSDEQLGQADSSIEEGTLPDFTNAEDPDSQNSDLNTHVSETNQGRNEHNSQHPHTVSNLPYNSAAPSLLGAEALVNKLNMASPKTGSPAPSMEKKSATPKHPLSREISPPRQASKRSSQVLDPSTADPAAKRSKTDGTSSSNPSSHRSSKSPPENRPTSKGSSKGSANHGSVHKEPSSASDKAKETSQTSTTEQHQDGQQSRHESDDPTSLPATANNSATTSQENPAPKFTTGSKTSMPAPASTRKLNSRTSLTPSIDLAPPSFTTPDGTIQPVLKIGNLRLVKGSIKSVPVIPIATMGTTFGRNTKLTAVHPDPMDIRVAKQAINIEMWYQGIKEDFAAGNTEWASNPKLVALIYTDTTRWIEINGVRLTKEKYGRLRSGDVISVFEPDNSDGDKGKEFLRYRAEFFIGASRPWRKQEDPFVAEETSRRGKATKASSMEASTTSHASASKA